jgi:hypothetical protein
MENCILNDLKLSLLFCGRSVEDEGIYGWWLMLVVGLSGGWNVSDDQWD